MGEVDRSSTGEAKNNFCTYTFTTGNGDTMILEEVKSVPECHGADVATTGRVIPGRFRTPKETCDHSDNMGVVLPITDEKTDSSEE